jgi:hypothetical protein
MMMLTGGLCPAYGTTQALSGCGYDCGQFSAFWVQNGPVHSSTHGYDAEGVNKYLYAQNNPINMVDPSGCDPDLISLNVTMTQMAVFALKVYNVTVNVKAAVANFSNGETSLQEGRDFDAAIDFSMACVNATFAISSAVAPLPPGAGPGLAAAGVGGRAQAIKTICANPKLEEWFAQNAVTYVNGAAAGLLGMFVAMNQDNSSSGGQANQGGSSSGGPQFVEPGKMKIGFMTRDGKLIGGKLYEPRIGHEDLASQLNLFNQVKSGAAIGISVGKTSDGSINSFGSARFGPLTDAQKAMANKLIR